MTMTVTMTRAEAADAVAAATAERDRIQANLLDLEASFGMRLLAGAKLTGVTKARWDAATADVAAMWELFTAYSGVVDRAAQVLSGMGRSAGQDLIEITSLLTGASVRLARSAPPLARRALTDPGYTERTVAAAVREMAEPFARVSEMASTAESVWTEASDRLERIASALGQARKGAAGLADDPLEGALTAADAELRSLRGVLDSDPLALWQHSAMDTGRLDRLAEQVRTTAARVAELAALRDDAERQISAVTAAVASAREAWHDARAARGRSAEKIVSSALPPAPPADVAAELDGRLAELEPLKAAGRWPRLAAELEAIGRQAAKQAQRCREIERAAVALLERREELRGLLGAYQAKGDRLGAAEDPALDACLQRARALLWVAPCDLDAAAEAVAAYQRGVLALRGGGTRR